MKSFLPKEQRSIIKKLEFIFTPKHGSWLNRAEIELSLFKRIESKDELVQFAKEYEQNRNQKTKPTNWQFKTVDARIKLRRLYSSTLNPYK